MKIEFTPECCGASVWTSENCCELMQKTPNKHCTTSKVGDVKRKGSVVKHLFDRICPSSRPHGANPVRSSSRLIPQPVKTAIHWLVAISSPCDRGCAQWEAWVSLRISVLCKLTTVGHGTTAPLLLVPHKSRWARKHQITLTGLVHRVSHR